MVYYIEMETMQPTPPPAPVMQSATPAVCPICHQPVLPQYYYCPNCGAKLSAPALSTTPGAQAWLYFFSIILPVICYLAITKWQGWKYYRSPDPKTKQIGSIACLLLAISSVLMIWFTIVWTQQEIQSSVNAINADMSPN